MIKVFIENRTGCSGLVSIPKLTTITKKMLKLLGQKRGMLSVVLVRNRQMRELHRRYLGKDRTTDVLAFGQGEGRFCIPDPFSFLGDVVVSVDEAKRVGPRFGHRWDEELLFYICHGILHLKGWRDSTPQDRVRMERKQEQILKRVLGRLWRSKRRKPLF